MSTTSNGQAAWPSAGTIEPIPEKSHNKPPEISSETVPTPENATESDTTTDTTVSEPATETVEKPSFESTLPAWVLDFKPKSKWSVGPRIKWWLYTRLNLFTKDWITPPETLTRRDMRAEILENEKYVNDNRQIVFITGTTSSGGGKTKTTVTGTVAAYTSMCCRNGAALIGLDLGADKTVSRFHMEEKRVLPTTKLISDLESGIHFYPSDLVPYTDSDADTGLILFKAKAEEDTETLDYKQYQVTGLLKYMNLLYPMLFCDGGPGLNLMTTNGMIEAADIYILPLKGISNESGSDVRKVIEHPPYELKAQNDRIIVAVSAVLRSKLNTRTQWEIAEKCGVDPKQVVLIPQDSYLDDQIAVNLKRVSIPALALKTRLMYSRLMKLNVQIAKSFQPIVHETIVVEEKHA